MRSMNSENSGKRVMNCNAPDIALWDWPGHVEVGTVSPQYFRLPTLSKLNVAYPPNEPIFLFTMNQ